MDILALEDDPALRFVLSEVLEEEGHTTYSTGRISGAASSLENEAPDLLLLDLMIGDQNSIRIADLAGYCTPDAEVIYVTGSNRFPKGEFFEMSRNASWVLRKPVDFFDLKTMLVYIEQSSSGKPEALSASLSPSQAET